MLSKVIPTQDIRRNIQKESLSDLEHSDTSSDCINFIDFPKNKVDIIDIIKIRNFFEKQIEVKADLIEEKNLTILQKILIVLNENNSSLESDDNNADIDTYKNKRNDSFSFNDQSTADCSSSYSFIQLDEKKNIIFNTSFMIILQIALIIKKKNFLK